MRAPVYVAIATGLIVFGTLGFLSIGAPFLLTGTAMLAVMPWRGRKGVIAAAIVAPWAFTLGYLLVAPLGCTSSGSGAPGSVVITTTCSSLLGLDYSGGAGYRAPLMPGVLAGLCLAAVALLVSRLVLRGRD